MKAIILIAFLAVAAGFAPRAVTLAWDYDPDGGKVDAFKIYAHTNAAEPLTNWVVIAEVPGTNRTVTIPMEAGKRFFYCTASNYWGESGPSNVTNVPGLVGTNKLSIGR